MDIINNAVVEFNKDGYLIYSESFPGAYVRGKTQNEALAKFQNEIEQYCKWAEIDIINDGQIKTNVVQEKESALNICDADSDVIFDIERKRLMPMEYERLKCLTIKSACDFLRLYESVPDKDATCLMERKTFYGLIPRTAREMYFHTNNVTNYYVGEIGIAIENLPDILKNRMQAIQRIEETDDYLQNKVYDGSYGEQWSLSKVLRRFIWHDRIHAKAMFRMCTKIWNVKNIDNPFYFIN